jgi:solute carrier family 8 (sodium/calcium exchanger)
METAEITSKLKAADPTMVEAPSGPAGFNLLVISAVSIVAVDEPKKIYDLLVFGTTSIFSIFAYVWLYLCLTTISPEEVDITEAWLTLIFFFVLVILAFIADRVNHKIQEKNKSKDDKEREEIENKLQQ